MYLYVFMYIHIYIHIYTYTDKTAQKGSCSQPCSENTSIVTSAKQDRQASLGHLSHPTHALLDCLEEASLDALLPDLIHLLLSYVHTHICTRKINAQHAITTNAPNPWVWMHAGVA